MPPQGSATAPKEFALADSFITLGCLPRQEMLARAAPKIARRLVALGQMSPALALLWGMHSVLVFLHSPSRCVEGGRKECFRCGSILGAPISCPISPVTQKAQKWKNHLELITIVMKQSLVIQHQLAALRRGIIAKSHRPDGHRLSGQTGAERLSCILALRSFFFLRKASERLSLKATQKLGVILSACTQES